MIAGALEAPTLADVEGELGKTFRAFAEATKSDLRALAACARGARRQFTEADLAAIAAPVLVAVGSQDEIAGDPLALSTHLRSGEAFAIPGRDHNRSVGDAAFKKAALGFLERWPSRNPAAAMRREGTAIVGETMLEEINFSEVRVSSAKSFLVGASRERPDSVLRAFTVKPRSSSAVS